MQEGILALPPALFWYMSPVILYFTSNVVCARMLCFCTYLFRIASSKCTSLGVSHVRLLALIEQQQIMSLSGCDVITRGLALMLTVLHFGHKHFGTKICNLI